MRALVTGATGRIGRAVHVRLAREHDVVGLDRLPSSTADLVGDVGDRALLRRALAGVDAVVHVAALHAPHVGSVPDLEFQRTNVDATRQLGELAVDGGVGRIVLTSTTALYGEANRAEGAAAWIDEDVEPRPRTIYHATKLEAEQALAELAARAEVAVTAIRMSRCFPEPAPVMAAYRLHRGIDARDVADAHARALLAHGSGFRSYVVSGETPFLRDDAAELASDAPAVLERRAPELVRAFAARGWALPASVDRVYDASRAMRELAWRPRLGYEEVLDMLDAGSTEVLPPERTGRSGAAVDHHPVPQGDGRAEIKVPDPLESPAS